MKPVSVHHGRLAYYFLLATLLPLQLFIGSRPAFPFIPVGIILLVATVIALASGIACYRTKTVNNKTFVIFSVACSAVILYLTVEAYVHVRQGDNYYYLRSLWGVLFVCTAWLSIKFRW